MQAKVIFSCLVFIICLKTVVLETVDLSPNQSLRREKRTVVSEIIADLRTGKVKPASVINQISMLDNMTFDLVVSQLDSLDDQSSSEINKLLQDLLDGKQKLTKQQIDRVHAMMKVLQGNMETTTMEDQQDNMRTTTMEDQQGNNGTTTISGATFPVGSFVSTTFFTMTVTYFTP